MGRQTNVVIPLVLCISCICFSRCVNLVREICALQLVCPLVVGCFTPLKEVPFQFPNQNTVLIFQSKEGSFKMYSMLCPYTPPNSLGLIPQFFRSTPKNVKSSEVPNRSSFRIFQKSPWKTEAPRSKPSEVAQSRWSTKPQVKPDGWRDGEERCLMEEPLVAQETHRIWCFFPWHTEKVIAYTWSLSSLLV